MKGRRDLNSPFSSRLCRVFCTCLIQKVSAPCSSSRFKGPSFPSCACLLSRIFSASLCNLAFARISLLQLEKVDGSIMSLAFTIETVATIWRRSMSSSGVGREVTWFGHRLSCRRRKLGYSSTFHLVHSHGSLAEGRQTRCLHLGYASTELDLSYSEFLQPLKTRTA